MIRVMHSLGCAVATLPPSDSVLGYLIMTNGNPDEWCAAIDQRRKVIGRSRQCDIPVPKRFSHVSRRHAEIHADGRGIQIRDLCSRSGTHINGVWIEQHREVWLIPGDRIWMGGLELEVVSEIPKTANVIGESDASEENSGGYCGPTQPLPAQLLAELSQAELAIVLWMGRGYFKDEEIAAKLFRSPNTVRTQINSIFRKLNVRSRADIIGLLKGCQ